ncbi:uncharacterized protein [Primulina eburnea]|uniref:uncharacterized protein n=1 Tax=Primulina eburnea TaxID=1245227 RepID=UPI003C6C11BC
MGGRPEMTSRVTSSVLLNAGLYLRWAIESGPSPSSHWGYHKEMETLNPTSIQLEEKLTPYPQKSAQSLMSTHRIDVFGILESKFDDMALNNMLRVRFQGMHVVNNFHLSPKGRIFVLWNPLVVDLDVIGLHEQYIHVRITCRRTQHTFYATFVYGLNTICQRRLLWNDLISFGTTCREPWMLLGDFNNVLSQEEKLGGLKVKNYETKDFVECINSIDLTDLRYIEKTIQIFNMWTLSDNFKILVRNNWKCRERGTEQFRLKHMFKRLKKPLHELNRNNFSHISVRAGKAKQELVALQESLLNNDIVTDGYKDVRHKAERLLEAERLFIAQKAKIQYTKQGDRCTKFFYDLIKRNNKRNAIVALTKSDGCTTTDMAEIANEFIIHYKSLLGSKVTTTNLHSDSLLDGPKVQSDEWQNLVRVPTRAEVDAALFDIDNDKAPGSDGYGAFFFKSTWHIIGSDVSKAVFELFRNGKLLKQWNHSIISLIPKMAATSSVNDYRPISCCTVFYKIISKMLVNRLRQVIGNLVDGAQAGFIEGRSIVDNIHLAQELLRKYARK